jgi:hypothetical protein
VGRAAARDEDLEDPDLAVLEAERACGQVQAPDAGALGPDVGDRLRPVLVEVRQPAPQREDVVLAQRLDVARLEPGALQRGHDVRKRRELAVGKDEAVDEALLAAPLGVEARDAVVERQSAGRSSLAMVAAYASRCAAPTCSYMPTLAILSYGGSSIAR